MRFKEFKTEAVKTKAPTEKQSSAAARYNSEVGMLAAFCDVDIATFDPNNPAAFFPAESLDNPAATFTDIIKYLAPNYKPEIFSKFYEIGKDYKQRVLTELNTVGEPAPTTYEWQGGANVNPIGTADVVFANHPTVHGVSVKTEAGITLANLTAPAVGLSSDDPLEHPDVFARYAEFEWLAMKYWAIQETLSIARETPGKPFAPIKPKYQIIYHPEALPVSGAPAKKTKAPAQVGEPDPTPPGIANAQKKLAVSKEPMGAEPDKPVQPLSEQVEQGYYQIFFKGKSVNYTERQIFAGADTNKEWQRVFGDYVQANWGSDAKLRELGDALFNSISEIFVDKIKNTLATKEKLHKVIAMGKLGYFYATPNDLYFVPGVDQISNIVIKDVVYGAPNGTAQKFIAKIGVEGSNNEAQVLVYIRYGNGMFEANPSVRIQDLKNPTALTWAKI
jgi:hypothetical protein